MKVKIATIFLKILFIIMTFVIPISIIISDYSRDTEIVRTRTSLALGWLILVAIIVGVGLLLLYTWLVNSIKQSPLSFGSLAFFGVTLLIILILIGVGLNTMQELISINAELFIENISKYVGTIKQIAIWVTGGMLALLLGFGIELQAD